MVAQARYNYPVLDREESSEQFQALQETIAHNRELRETTRELLHANRDLRDFLLEILLIAQSRRQARKGLFCHALQLATNQLPFANVGNIPRFTTAVWECYRQCKPRDTEWVIYLGNQSD